MLTPEVWPPAAGRDRPLAQIAAQIAGTELLAPIRAGIDRAVCTRPAVPSWMLPGQEALSLDVESADFALDRVLDQLPGPVAVPQDAAPEAPTTPRGAYAVPTAFSGGQRNVSVCPYQRVPSGRPSEGDRWPSASAFHSAPSLMSAILLPCAGCHPGGERTLCPGRAPVGVGLKPCCDDITSPSCRSRSTDRRKLLLWGPDRASHIQTEPARPGDQIKTTIEDNSIEGSGLLLPAATRH